jgi:hypothetical protein
MKILECKRGQIYDIGFIDPYFVNKETLRLSPRDTEDHIVKALRFHEHRREILFPYNFE